MNFPVVFEDDWFYIVQKPAGLLTIPSPRKEERTLTSILNRDLKDSQAAYRLHPCHRLDKDTSGLIIYAKGKSAQEKMMELFHQKKVSKIYVAFVQGYLRKPQGEIRLALEGKPALTRYKLIEERKNYSIIEAYPETGRTNQIRLHFKMLGNPILGERKFAFRKDYALKVNSLCLHAAGLSFEHPYTHKKIDLSSELPLALRNILEKYPC